MKRTTKIEKAIAKLYKPYEDILKDPDMPEAVKTYTKIALYITTCLIISYIVSNVTAQKPAMTKEKKNVKTNTG